MKEYSELSYEQAFSRLEEIAESMGNAAVPLDKLMDLYEEGMKLAAHCRKLLTNYESRLEKVAGKTIAEEMGGMDEGFEPNDEESLND